MSHSDSRKISGSRCLCHTLLGTVCIPRHPRSVRVLGCFTLRRSHGFLSTAVFVFSSYASRLHTRSPSVLRLRAKTVTLTSHLRDVAKADAGGSFCSSTRFPIGTSPCCSLSRLQSEVKPKQEVRFRRFPLIDRRFAPTSTDLMRHNLPPVVRGPRLGRLSPRPLLRQPQDMRC